MAPSAAEARALPGADGGGGAEASLSAEELRRNYIWFAVNFAVNHGVVTTPLVVSSSTLYHSAAYTGNALLNVVTMLSAVLLGAPIVGTVGVKGALLLGMSFYCIYAGCFCVAYAMGKEQEGAQLALFSVGSSCGGLAAGVLWTAQGSYFSRTVDLVHRKEGGERPALTASLAGTFAALYLSCEVLAKLAWSFADKAGVTGWYTAAAFTAIGVLATLAQTRVLPLRPARPPEKWTSMLKAALGLWSDPCLFMLAGINWTFGFSAAFMNGYINQTYTSKQLGTFAVPMMAAFTALLAAIFSRILGRLSAKLGKAPMIVIGSISFFAIPLCFFALSCCEDWGWWLVALYFLQGIGRAVYESTGKGVFADFFQGNPTGAFANNILQSTAAFAICFFLSDFLKGPTLAAIAMGLSVLTPIGYFGALRIRSAQTVSAPEGAGASLARGSA